MTGLELASVEEMARELGHRHRSVVLLTMDHEGVLRWYTKGGTVAGLGLMAALQPRMVQTLYEPVTASAAEEGAGE